jgi:tripartite-type tricarboxylate transporter receptor subunit TctC
MKGLAKLALGAAASAAVLAGPAAAEYPEETITIIVPFSAGGGTDLTGRTIAEFLEGELGVPVVVVNRPGAGGEIGLTELANAEPDGYTLGIINTPGIVTIPIERDPQWSMDSFTFIAGLVEDPATVSVLSTSDIETIEDLVAAAEDDPGGVTVGTQGIGSAGHISISLLEQAAGVEFLPVPFGGAAPARTALLAGELDATTANLGEALNFAEGQPWRILGVMSPNPSPMAPDLPTFKSAGYDIVGGSIRGFGGPDGLPEDVVQTLSTAIASIMEDPEFLERAEQTAQPVNYIPREAYVDILERSKEIHQELWETNPWRE